MFIPLQTKPPSDHHLLPFIGRDKHGELYKLYQDLVRIMVKIHNEKSHNEKSEKHITELTQLATSW